MTSSDSPLDTYEQRLLEGWEDVFKKGQLTLWIFLALKDGPKHMAEIKQFVYDATDGSMTADDQSMYRALRRFFDTELIDFRTEPGNGGPERKIYILTEVGKHVLQSFVDRNISGVFYKSQNKHLIERSV